MTNWLASVGVTANQVTSICSNSINGHWSNYLCKSPGIMALTTCSFDLLLRMALNAIDGMLAREHSMESKLGAVLNELGDVVSDAFLYLPLAVVSGFSPEIIVLIVIVSIISEMVGVVSLQIGASRRYDGPMGKSDRAFVFGSICLVVVLGVNPSPWLDWVLSIITLLIVLTIFNRAKKALGEAK